jgi:predicted O-methyltransferase YrrM
MGRSEVMKIDKIGQKVDGIPHMSIAQGEAMTGFIIDNQIQNILELGFRHGVSTCYMAGALDELGRGSITTIDVLNARNAEPNIESLLASFGLQKFVTVHYEPTSYTWRLMKMLEEDPEPRFDFCYLDGAHNWFVDGFAFFLIDRLLVPGGWIIFDDLDWTYASSPTLKETEGVKSMPPEERETAQVRNIYELLVKPHPSYDEFIVKEGWAYARKSPSASGVAKVQEAKKEIIYTQKKIGLSAVVSEIAKKIVRR